VIRFKFKWEIALNIVKVPNMSGNHLIVIIFKYSVVIMNINLSRLRSSHLINKA